MFDIWFGQIWPEDQDMVLDQSFRSLVYCVCVTGVGVETVVTVLELTRPMY